MVIILNNSNGMSVISDLLALLHERWMPDERKDIIRHILMDMVDNMGSKGRYDDWK